MATKHRRNVWELGNDWADDILWYARGVKAMKAHPLKQRTSWRFYAAMHGFFDQLWELYGYFSASDTRPPNADIGRFWDQCQHGSWYFLPWCGVQRRCRMPGAVCWVRCRVRNFLEARCE